jgi:hypothetical protein
MSSFDKLVEMKKAYERAIQDDGKRLLGEAFKELFARHPKIIGVRWEQYTPYFNDGSPCTFGVRDFRYRFEGMGEEAGDYSDGYAGEYDDEFDKSGCKTAIAKFEKPFADQDDVFLAVFGDHVQVTATAKGFDVEEYTHD